jgi:transposase
MPTSPDTLLRAIRRTPLPQSVTPRVLGVDDWAFRRGHRYGTILCDLERHRIVDLLPERSSASLREWLVAHPGVEVISRDRGDYYIQGAQTGAPQAVQVADRWHLLTNLREALTKGAERFGPQILAAVRAAARRALDAAQAEKSTTESAEKPPEMARNLHRTQQLGQLRRTRRFQRYEQVLELHHQRISLREIARRLHMHRETVRRFLRAGAFPERAVRKYRRETDVFLAHLRHRWDEGNHNAAQLTQELRQQGFQGSYDMVRRRVAGWRREHRNRSESRRSDDSFRRPSANHVGWLLLYPPSNEHDSGRLLLNELASKCPPLALASRLAVEFVTLLKQRNAAGLEGWVDRACREKPPPELRRFAEGLRDDWSAVQAAFRLPWSNGQTEGHVNRLKLIKRQMFGRAGFDLLKQRLLNVA